MKDMMINKFLNINSDFFNSEDIPTIKNFLINLNEDSLETLKFIQFRDPRVFLAISFFGGALGIDRFLIGDIGLGLLKLFFNIITLFIPQFIDLFIIQRRIRKKNFEKLMKLL